MCRVSILRVFCQGDLSLSLSLSLSFSLTGKRFDLVLQSHQPLGCAKVRDLDLPRVHVDEHIVSLDVPVDDSLVVEVLDATGDLTGVVDYRLLVQWTPFELEQ